MLAAEARKQKSECGALVVNGHINTPQYRLRPLPAALLVVVRRSYSIVMPKPLPRCASQVLNCVAQMDSRGATQVLDRGAQADARGAAQALDRGAQAVARGAARCASQVLDRGAQASASLCVAIN